MVHKLAGPEQQLTELQQLMARVKAKQVLRERISEAWDAGDLAEVERLWAEVEAI